MIDEFRVLVVLKESKLKEHEKTVKLVKKLCEKYQWHPFSSVSFVKRDDLEPEDFKWCDLVISVGGDGTVLKTASYMGPHQGLLAINSDRTTSEGVLTVADRFDIEKKFNMMFGNGKGDYGCEGINRLEAIINGKSVDLALNEICVSSPRIYHTSRYFLSFDGQREEQKSNGLVISTAAGSTAMYKSVTGKSFSGKPDEARFVVMYPYQGKLTGVKMKRGILHKGDELILESKMRDGCIAFDGDEEREYRFIKGDTAVIRISDKPLSLKTFYEK